MVCDRAAAERQAAGSPATGVARQETPSIALTVLPAELLTRFERVRGLAGMEGISDEIAARFRSQVQVASQASVEEALEQLAQAEGLLAVNQARWSPGDPREVERRREAAFFARDHVRAAWSTLWTGSPPPASRFPLEVISDLDEQRGSRGTVQSAAATRLAQTMSQRSLPNLIVVSASSYLAQPLPLSQMKDQFDSPKSEEAAREEAARYGRVLELTGQANAVRARALAADAPFEAPSPAQWWAKAEARGEYSEAHIEVALLRWRAQNLFLGRDENYRVRDVVAALSGEQGAAAWSRRVGGIPGPDQVQWEGVGSSAVDALAYHAPTNTLYARYANGGVYAWSGVSQEEYDDLKGEWSIGRALQDLTRNSSLTRHGRLQ